MIHGNESELYIYKILTKIIKCFQHLIVTPIFQNRLVEGLTTHCDVVVNNICESFNSKLAEGCDVPILNCLDFIREYLMKKIVNVEKEIRKEI